MLSLEDEVALGPAAPSQPCEHVHPLYPTIKGRREDSRAQPGG